MDITKISSARQAYEAEKAEKAELARQHARDAATLGLGKQAKSQTVMLRAQLSESQKTNELLTKQALDAKQFAEKADRRSFMSIAVAIASAIIAAVSMIFSVLSFMKGC